MAPEHVRQYFLLEEACGVGGGHTRDLALTDGIELEVRPLPGHVLDGLLFGAIAHGYGSTMRHSGHLRGGDRGKASVGGGILVGVAHGGWCHFGGRSDTASVSSSILASKGGRSV